MSVLVGIVLGFLLFSAGLWWRRRLRRPIDYMFTMKLAGISLPAGGAVVGFLYPLAFALVSRAIHGGSIAQNLPAGVTEDVILATAALGAAATVIGAAYAFVGHVDSVDPTAADRTEDPTR